MYEAKFAPVSNRADWFGTIELIDDDTSQVILDLTGVTARLDVRAREPRCAILTATTEDGHIELIEGGIIQWHFTADEMRRMSPGTYEIGITVTRDDITEQELVGSLPIIDGVVRP